MRKTRWTAADNERWGYEHRKERRRWVAPVASATLHCGRCGLLIQAGQPWDLDHLPNGRRAPSHRRCNRQTMLHARQAAQESELKTSREW